MNQKRGIVDQAVTQLQSLGFTVELGRGASATDSVVLHVRRGSVSLHLCGEVRRQIRREAVGALAARFRDAAAAILIAELVTPAVAEDLRRAGVQFVDTAGNVFLDGSGVFVWVVGKTGGTARPRLGVSRPAPTRVLFSLLVQPALLNAPLRQLAKSSGVSLGAAQASVSTLVARGEIVEVRGRRRFGNPVLVAKRWPEMYLEHLRPQLELARFRARHELWWAEVDLRPLGASWSGEVAAAKMGTLLRPATVTIFTEDIPTDLVVASRLAADVSGTVGFYRKFWSSDPDLHQPDLVPALLVYADLLANDDARSLEAAKEIFDKHVLRPFGAT